MKRTMWSALTCTMIIVFGTLGNSLPTPRLAASTETKSPTEKTGASPNLDQWSQATAVVNRPKLNPKRPSNTYMTKSPSLYDLERVEVLARSVTFPEIIKQGEDMMSVQFPTAAILCLDVAYYAGRVEGLILAMDRRTVEEHELHWTIDDATESFQSCLKMFLLEAYAEQNITSVMQAKGLQEDLAERIEMIQEKLREGLNVKIKRSEISASEHSNGAQAHCHEKLSSQ